MPLTVPRTELGRMLRAARLAKGWTQEELEARSGVSQTNISTIESGKTQRPEDATLYALGSVLDVAIDDLRAAMGWVIRKGVEAGEETTIRIRGKVPADTTRWVAFETEERTVDIPTGWVNAARFPLFAVEVSGDCLLERGIASDDVVVCEEYHDQAIRDGSIVLIRIEDEYTLKAWHAVSPSEIELRNGAGAVVRRVSRTSDYQVIGIARHKHGDL